MDDSPARRMGEPGQQPLHHTRDLGEGQFVNQWPERASRHVLHRDERRALVLEVLVHGDDVRMAQRAGPTELAQEPLRERRVRRVEGAELLERHMAVKIDLPREVDRSRATAPDLAQDLVPADASAEHHLPRTMVDGRHERKAPDPRDPRDHPSEWTVKDSNAPANRHFLARVGAPVGARRARERSSLTRLDAPEHVRSDPCQVFGSSRRTVGTRSMSRSNDATTSMPETSAHAATYDSAKWIRYCS